MEIGANYGNFGQLLKFWAIMKMLANYKQFD